VTTVERPGKELDRLDLEECDVAIVSREHLGERSLAILARLRALPERPEVVVLVGDEDAEDRARLLAAGCLAVVNSTLPDEALRDALKALLARSRAALEKQLGESGIAPESRSSLGDFATRSPAMRQFMATVRRVVDADSSLLLTGETGVGKEWLARAIHAEGRRSAGPFVAVNCAAVPESLMESELFGHEKGSFTGASHARRGWFELAHRGVLFLDEIADLPHHLQVKLLRVVQERAIQRVGSERLIPIDVRLVAATNRNLEDEMAAGRFRSDLYYRLSVVTLLVPPLRDRREDIPALVESYMAHYRAVLGRPVDGVSPEAMAALAGYAWPGNVRELINTVERAVLLTTGSIVGVEDLPHRIGRLGRPEGGSPPAPVAGPVPGVTLESLLGKPIRSARREVIDAFERAYLNAQLRTTRGRIGETAGLAGIKERSLFDLMRRHGLKKGDYRG
jgi:DNA-binding NtrC family response regulator